MDEIQQMLAEIIGRATAGAGGPFYRWLVAHRDAGTLPDEQAAVAGMLLAAADGRLDDVDALVDAVGPRQAAYAAVVTAGMLADHVAVAHGLTRRELLEGMAGSFAKGS